MSASSSPSIPSATALRANETRPSGTPRDVLPGAAATKAPRCSSPWWISPAARFAPTPKRSPCAPPALIAICRRACRSEMRPAISSWRAPRLLSASSRSSNPPIPCARRCRSTRSGGSSRRSRSTTSRWSRAERRRCRRFTGSAYSDKQIQGLAAITGKRHFARVISENGVAFARGTLVDLTFNEEQFAGGGVFLFAAVLEYFLGLYAGMNSFSQLVARSQQRKEAIRRWPPRAGQKVLL